MKNGFTLVELMTVIALLGILSLIAIPAIDGSLKNSREKLAATQEKQIIKGAKEYYSEHLDELPKDNNNKNNVRISKLKADGYLPDNIVNPKTGKEYEDIFVVEVTKVNNNYKYEIVEVAEQTNSGEETVEEPQSDGN